MRIAELLTSSLLLWRGLPESIKAGKFNLSVLIEFQVMFKKLTSLLSDQFLEQEATPENLQPLIEFLAQHWQNSVTSPDPFDLSNLMTVFCFNLAKEIAPVVNKSLYELFIPSIEGNRLHYTGVTTTEYLIANPQLGLPHFVLSDDKKCLIEVEACLELAEERGLLHHTTLTHDVKPSLLSEPEKRRLLAHSKQAKSYWYAIEAYETARSSNGSFGAHLMQLIMRLRQGEVKPPVDETEQQMLERAVREAEMGYRADVVEEETEYNAGMSSHLGAIEFQEFLDSITSEEQSALLSIEVKVAEKKYTIADLWDRVTHSQYQKALAQQKSGVAVDSSTALVTFNSDLFCSHLLANDFETILKESEWLFSKFSREVTSADAILTLQQHLLEAKQELKAGLVSQQLTREKKVIPLNLALWRRFLSSFPLNEVLDAARYVFEEVSILSADIVNILSSLPQDSRFTFLQNLGAQKLQAVFIVAGEQDSRSVSFFEGETSFPPIIFLDKLCELLPASEQLNLIKMLKIETVRELTLKAWLPIILKTLALENRLPFLEYLGTEHIFASLQKNANALKKTVALLPEDNRFAFLMRLDPGELVNSLNKADDLTVIINLVPADKRLDMIKFLGAENVAKNFTDPEKLNILLQQLQPNERLSFFNLVIPQLSSLVGSIYAFRIVLTLTPPQDHQALLQLLGSQNILHIFNCAEKKPQTLIGALNLLSADQRLTLAQNLGSNLLGEFVPDLATFSTLLSLLPSSARHTFVSMFSDAQLHHIMMSDSFFFMAAHRMDNFQKQEFYPDLLFAMTAAYRHRQQLKLSSHNLTLFSPADAQAIKDKYQRKDNAAFSLEKVLTHEKKSVEFSTEFADVLGQSSTLRKIGERVRRIK